MDKRTKNLMDNQVDISADNQTDNMANNQADNQMLGIKDTSEQKLCLFKKSEFHSH